MLPTRRLHLVVATVDAEGKITAVAMGEATITAKTQVGDKTATCRVEVTASKASILGKWTLEKTNFDGEIDYPNTECTTKKDYSEFLQNGGFRDIVHLLDCSETNKGEDFSWTLLENWLTLEEDDGNKTIFTIIFLSNSKLVLYVEKEYENGKEILVDGDNDGVRDENYYYFKKLEE